MDPTRSKTGCSYKVIDEFFSWMFPKLYKNPPRRLKAAWGGAVTARLKPRPFETKGVDGTAGGLAPRELRSRACVFPANENGRPEPSVNGHRWSPLYSCGGLLLLDPLDPLELLPELVLGVLVG